MKPSHEELPADVHEEQSPLPSRTEYHKRRRYQSKKKRGGKSPLLIARIILVVFLLFVMIVLAYSISGQKFL